MPEAPGERSGAGPIAAQDQAWTSGPGLLNREMKCILFKLLSLSLCCDHSRKEVHRASGERETHGTFRNVTGQGILPGDLPLAHPTSMPLYVRDSWEKCFECVPRGTMQVKAL